MVAQWVTTQWVWVMKHWVRCVLAFVLCSAVAVIVLWLVGDLKFAEALALVVGLFSFPVSLVALSMAIHTDGLVTGMANGLFDQAASSLEKRRREIEHGTLQSAEAMATVVKTLSRIASVADEDVKSKLMQDDVLPAIRVLEHANLSPWPAIQRAAAELVKSAKEWGVLEDEVHESAGQLSSEEAA